MRVFFDHNVPEPLQLHLQHTVVTARQIGWQRLRNGILLRAVEEQGYEVFVTCDQSIPYQQNLSSRQLAMILLTRNQWPLVQRQLKSITSAIEAATPGSFQVVDCSG